MTSKILGVRFIPVIAGLLAFVLPQSVAASIIRVSIAANSQANSRPSIDDVYDVQAQGGVFNDNLGIGLIINPVYVAANDQADFALHQNGNLFGPSVYGGFVPNPNTSSVYYTFDHATIVSGVEIIQHYNGVTGIGGNIGNSFGAMSSLGSVLGSSSMTDGTSSIFNFGNSSISGTHFKLTIDRTLLSYAFALHRAYLLDENGSRIYGINEPNAPNNVPESGSSLLVFALGIAVMVVLRRGFCIKLDAN